MQGRKAELLVLAAVIVFSAGVGLSARKGKSGGVGDFALYVAPEVICPQAPCNWVTIHTDVAYASVEDVAVDVDGQAVAVAQTFADDRGNLVAQLAFEDAAAIVDPPQATVKLSLVVAGRTLVAAYTVQVR
ncbi:MAG: hypothetical protein GX591_06240 [Planctomycetes bacterium]|nr:hypothetical protein [Planctomycetota bacterium]